MLWKDFEQFNFLFKPETYRTLRDFIKESGWKMLAIACAINLLLTMFSLTTILSFIMLVFSVFMVVKLRWKEMREGGLIQFLPGSMHTILLKRSIFDVLCDLWFFPRIGLIVKAVMTPFFIEIQPEQAIQTLDVLSDSDRKMFLTKGVVYVMPKWLKHLILPKTYKLHNKIHDFMDSEDEQPVLERKAEAFGYELPSFLSDKSKNELTADGARPTITPELVKPQEIRPKRTSVKNKVILSSQMLKSISHFPGRLTDCWDNLSKFKHQADTKRKSLQRSGDEEDEKELLEFSQEIKQAEAKRKSANISPLGMIFNLIELKKQKLLNKVSQKFLIFLFLLSVTAFATNLGFSKRYRRITKSILVSASYAGLVGMGALTLSAIIMKTRTNHAQSTNLRD